jgi:glutamate N-acetyltransferase/amino-acid N-acetyltransferase
MSEFEPIEGGGVTSAQGFVAGAVCAGLYARGPKAGQLDLALLFSERECTTGGVFTTNLVRSAPVGVTESRLDAGNLRALIVNSGCANAPFGVDGTADAEEMTEMAARLVGVPARSIGVASTGVTGVLMPMDKVRAAAPLIKLSREGGADFATAIMTTDTKRKEVAVRVRTAAGEYTIGGCAKGSGMIHPNMATMLAYVTTDAAVEQSLLRRLVRETADATFNMLTIDGDTSCSDTFLTFANGAAGLPRIETGTPEAAQFERALRHVCEQLVRQLARDGEGATHLLVVEVTGAASVADARLMARTVGLSSLVKTAVAGSDPNWGRVLVAAGRSGAQIDTLKARVRLQGELLFDRGKVVEFDEEQLSGRMAADEVCIELELGLGDGAATAWGCDLTTDYVHINADYRT